MRQAASNRACNEALHRATLNATWISIWDATMKSTLNVIAARKVLWDATEDTILSGEFTLLLLQTGTKESYE